ncbi:hypothetical protein POVWA2_059100 [Plasmodium ovale wallikeri]|uniref:Protein FAM32A n=2 Tax=Plasmodium ovale TaxID=36330 RepID=A0A1A9A143_PLAOA|nr:hypothetical protein POVWA1_059760 [Plasmodium ovale wallikeri]SBT49918.1 hypothetical protein POVWA2_059100 [Plasmodium ovale wallikeri]SBT82663.1 conserved Plasmodium protein, unknown function [Plasmodium ovale]
MKDSEFIGGQLKLKGVKIKKSSKKKKKKKEKREKGHDQSDGEKSVDHGKPFNTNKQDDVPFREDHDQHLKTDTGENVELGSKIMDEEEKLKEILHLNLTESEKAYQLVLKKREKQRIQNLLKESYRERLQKFNDNLASLSEHFDIPKVGPG